jgi:hypothetical protein
MACALQASGLCIAGERGGFVITAILPIIS